MRANAEIEALLRDVAPGVLGSLVRRHGQFDACEDALQEALLAAVLQWPGQGIPDNPAGWLVRVASRQLIDEWRSNDARRRRETGVIAALSLEPAISGPGDERVQDQDDTLALLFLCCHPALSAPSQVALTLRAIGGLTTVQIARAFLVPEATMAQRISRAKQQIRTSALPFGMPPEAERAARVAVVLHVLYLIFNEGYTASSGPELQRGELTREAIRLTRWVHRLLPDDGEVAGLLSLMLLTDARRSARTGPDGMLIPLAQQDRSLWDQNVIAEGVALISGALAVSPLGPFQVQAAIAATHAEAERAEETDWRQILELYGLLARLAPGPMVSLNRAVAAAMVHGPRAGLLLLDRLEDDRVLAGHHRLDAVRAHLLEQAGDRVAARASYLQAARKTTSLPERRYLESRAAGHAKSVANDAGREPGR